MILPECVNTHSDRLEEIAQGLAQKILEKIGKKCGRDSKEQETSPTKYRSDTEEEARSSNKSGRDEEDTTPKPSPKKCKCVGSETRTLPLCVSGNFRRSTATVSNGLQGLGSKSEIRSSVGPISWQGRQITDPKEIADALDEQYNSVYSKPLCNTTIYQPSQNREGPQLEDIEFNREDIEQAIASINAFSAAGPDMVPAILLKKCSHTLSTPLYILWRTSLDAGQVPRVLKHSLVTPIFKGGDKAAAKNYRPVGKTSHIIKIFERILVKRIVDFMKRNELYNKGQHGFRQGRSCLSQLLQHRTDILGYLEKEIGVDVVYLDFSKAFDKVDQLILMKKVEEIVSEMRGILDRGEWGLLILLDLSAAFDTVVHDVLLRVCEHIGIEGTALSYLKSYLEDYLSAILVDIKHWMDSRKLKLDEDKTECLFIGRENDFERLGVRVFNVNNSDITVSKCVKSLGVLLDSELMMREQINQTNSNTLESWEHSHPRKVEDQK
ncbi:uncharacterized protein LOC143035614 [Oratosquilla oratoria]|uniref:uncharacterized protein LOC143035614 n=1 Tax=Oratosquilla oratoria TaxID=337810 RepID=UPI003F7669C4